MVGRVRRAITDPQTTNREACPLQDYRSFVKSKRTLLGPRASHVCACMHTQRGQSVQSHSSQVTLLMGAAEALAVGNYLGNLGRAIAVALALGPGL